jgi:hypothetical protein
VLFTLEQLVNGSRRGFAPPPPQELF